MRRLFFLTRAAKPGVDSASVAKLHGVPVPLVRNDPAFARQKARDVVGRINPHGGREIELLLAGEKPAGLFVEIAAADLERVRVAGLLVVDEDVVRAKPVPPGQLQLELGEDVIRTWPRTFYIARGQSELEALLDASRHGTAADLGRALGYSEADTKAFCVQFPGGGNPPPPAADGGAP
jgi:hypothetical protein